ncbi:hypothetical protein LRP88_03595 [Fusarium phalaenopsidis]
MDTNPSPGAGLPISGPGTDAGSPHVPRRVKREKSSILVTVAESQVPPHQTPSESTEAQPASSGSDASCIAMDMPEENLLKLHDQMKQEKPGTGSNLACVKSEDSDSKQFPRTCKGAQDTSTDWLGDAEMLDAMEIDSDSSSDDSDNEGDPDFQSGSGSDSDGSEGTGRRVKQRPKPGITSLSQASTRCQELENRRNKFLVKQMKQGLTGDETQRLEELEKQLSEAQKQLDESEEEEKEDKKRKSEEEAGGPKKAQKTTAGSRPKKSTKDLAASARAELLRSLGDVDQSINDGSVPTMGAIQASTYHDQMRQITQGIPDEFDTRRTKTQRKDLKEAKSSFGYKNVKAVNGKWKLKGMATGLMSHQIVVSAWMARREAQGLHPAGGLLADDMGLGKTITTLACIVGHPPEKEDRDEFSRATLVVVNNRQTAIQWSKQIEKHCLSNFASKTEVYSKDLIWSLKKWGGRNMVIATYLELVAQFPTKKALQQLRGVWAGDSAGFEKALRRKLGPLFKINWYRVVLDEAHTIKNHTSSKFYPYLRFLGCRFAVSLKRFKEEYLNGRQSNDNLAALVSMIMYRRKQDETFVGRKIVDLPNDHGQDLWIPVEDWEMAMIRAVDNRYKSDKPAEEQNGQGQDDEAGPEDVDQASGPAEEAENDATDNDAAEEDAAKPQDDDEDDKSPFAMRRTRLTRVRQAVSHPLNLEKFLREKYSEGDIDKATEKLKKEVEKIQNDTDEANTHAEQLAQDKAVRDKFSVGAHQIETLYKDLLGGAKDMAKLRALAANEHQCEHIFCERCLTVKVCKGAQTVKTELTCPVKGCLATLAVGEDVTTPECIKTALSYIKDFKEPGRDSIGTHWPGDVDGDTSFFLATCGREDIHFGPVKMPWGSKLRATMEVILTWQKEAPEDKIIVFAEFTRTSKALGCILEKIGIDFLYFNGTVTTKRKDMALREFCGKPERKILLASMKCGGQALDLPVANRVIIVDMWYNKTQEQQAFKRVHRIGQKKETHLVRILARGSIDERLYMLQNAKQTIVNRALQDDGYAPKFSNHQELQWLFSDKNKEDLMKDMATKVRGKKGKGKATEKA